MKKRVIFLTMLALTILVTFLAVISCGRAELQVERQLARTSSAVRSMDAAAMPRSAPVAMNDTLFAGTGFTPQETQAAFHDVHNYGSGRTMTDESESMSANLNNVERKLIKRAFVEIRVENLDAADSSIAKLMNEYNAYAASTRAEENSRFYSLRVPAAQYDFFLAEMNGIGRLIRRSENTEDVTLRYYDLEGRLEMKRELLRTFQSYLTRARNIEEILSVETRIAGLQNDIDRTGSQLRFLANSVDYATIDLSLFGPVAASQIQSITLGERIKQLFGNFGAFLSTVAVVIVGALIYGIPLLALLVLLFWVLFGRIGLIRKLWGLVKGK